MAYITPYENLVLWLCEKGREVFRESWNHDEIWDWEIGQDVDKEFGRQGPERHHFEIDASAVVSVSWVTVVRVDRGVR